MMSRIHHPLTMLLATAAMVAAACLSPAPSTAAAAEASNEQAIERLRITLFHAMPRGDEKHPADAPSMILNVQRDGDHWRPVFATAGNYNQHDHPGYVRAAKVTDDAVEIDFTLLVRGDGWHPGGRYLGRIELTRDEDDTLSGHFEGTFRDREIEGRAEGFIAPPPRHVGEPVESRERPRLLFRAEDLPALRERAETRFGQLALSKMDHSPASSAFRYAVTGDEDLAADTRRRVEALMEDRDHGGRGAISRFWAWRVEQAAIAFDLCYDAWDADFRSEVAEYLHDMAHLLLYNRGTMDSAINWGHMGPHGPALHWAAGVAGLAIAGEKGPKPARPTPPHLLREDEGLIAADADYEPGDGVPVFNFESDQMPRRWIYAGAFPSNAEPLAGHEKRAAARPAVGDEIGEGEDATTWREVDEEKLLYSGSLTGNRAQIELTGPSGVVQRSQSYYFLALRNDRERWVRAHTGHGGVDMYLGGQHVSGGDVVRLEPGTYPWLFNGPIGDVNPWAKAFAEPKLIELDDQEIAEVRKEAERNHEHRLADWRHELEQWRHHDGADVRYLRIAAAAEQVMDTVFAEMLGRGGGYLSGGRHKVAMDGPNKYALMYRNVKGRNPGFFDEVADYIPRAMFVHPYRPDGQVIGQEVDGVPGFVTSWPDADRDLANEHFATMLPLLPERYQPVALWAWHDHTDGSLEDESSMRKLLSAPSRGFSFRQEYGSFDTHPIYAFLNYPMEMEPEAPAGVMPLTWESPDYGFYGFRNEWSGRDSQFITQLFAATRDEGTGTLRVAGLGQVWSHGLEGGVPQRRFFENVVQLPGVDIQSSARGRVLHHATREDGGGTLSLDLDDVYAAVVTDDDGRPIAAPYEAYGRVRRPHAFGDSGITGLRAMAVDYSGKSGADAMIVLVDRIDGHDKPLWAWQLESESEGIMQENIDTSGEGREVFKMENYEKARNGDLLLTESQPARDDRVRVHEDGFTYAQGDAAMRATFITPASPSLQLAERIQYHRTNIEVVRRDQSTGIFAEGDDGFFVILTFQDGPAPEVEVIEGSGLDATVRIGDQTVRFDGEKIILGE